MKLHGREVALLQDRTNRLLQEIRLPFLHYQYGVLALEEVDDFRRNQRIGDVEDVNRNLARAKGVGEPQLLQRTKYAVI